MFPNGVSPSVAVTQIMFSFVHRFENNNWFCSMKLRFNLNYVLILNLKAQHYETEAIQLLLMYQHDMICPNNHHLIERTINE